MGPDSDVLRQRRTGTQVDCGGDRSVDLEMNRLAQSTTARMSHTD
jgi:hypothetical protein